jgi:hypothetical protein
VGERVGVACKLAPGDADGAVAGGREGSVSGAVVFEGLAGGVDVVAVELDDEALVGPEGVGLVWAERLVGRRSWEAVLLGEVEERGLEVAADDGLADLSLLLERAFQCSGPFASWVARDQGIEGKRA